MKKILVGALLLATLEVGGWFLYHQATKYRGELIWNIYKGELADGSVVEIDESQATWDDHIQRIVNIRPKGAPSYVGITGHDYHDTGHWDRIFLCSEGYGCNDFYIDSSGQRTWEPCMSGKEKGLKPYTLGEVMDMARKLDDAMIKVHRPECLVQTLEQFRTKEAERLKGQNKI